MNLVYFEMLERVQAAEGQTMEAAVAELNLELQVSSWRVFGAESPAVDADAPVVPSWWTGDADASGSFLAAMGVALQ